MKCLSRGRSALRSSFQSAARGAGRGAGGSARRVAGQLAALGLSLATATSASTAVAAEDERGWDDWDDRKSTTERPASRDAARKDAAAEADPDPFDRPGFYVGIAGVYAFNPVDGAIEDYLEDELGEQGNVDIDESGGLSARVGYRAASWFAAELQYEWISRFDVDVSGDLGPGGSAIGGKLYDIEGHSLTFNTRWIVPFWRIQPYLLIGAGYSFYDVGRGPIAGPLEAEDDDIEIEGGNQGAFAGRAGVGIDFYLTQRLVLMTEATALVTVDGFETPDEGAIDDLYYVGISAGLQYRF